jgi:2-oxoglutarate dehydrogenase E2 component (dihydrolipoamide succinyltransferase)
MSILQEILVPQETVNDEFVTVAKNYYDTGDEVKPGDILVDIETSKAVVAIEAAQVGFVEYLCEEGDDVTVGNVIIKIHDKAQEAQAGKDKSSSVGSGPQPTAAVETLFSKDARALMKKNNIDEDRFAGRDFVSIDDVRGLLVTTPNAQAAKAADEKKVTPAPPKTDPEKVDIEKIPTQKRTEIKYLSQVQSSGLTSTINVYLDVTGILQFVNKSMEVFKNSLLPLITYEVARLLKKHREFNAYFVGEFIAYYKDVHIGIAVDIDDGLKVLKLADTATKSLQSIENELFDLTDKYLDRHLTLDDITGSTFTITDLSSEKVDFFIPLINKEQSAILGISTIDDKLKRCILSLTFDHRVTAGKQASIFLGELKARIESYDLARQEEETGERLKLKRAQKCSICMKTLKEDEELNGIGFLRLLDHNGTEQQICQICLARF